MACWFWRARWPPFPLSEGLVVLSVVRCLCWFCVSVSLSLLGGPILGPVDPLMFVVFFSVAFFPCGLAGLGGWSLWSCEAVGRRPSGRGRHSSWPFVYLLFSFRIPAPVSILLLVGKGCSTDINFSKAEVVFYFYVHDIFRMLPSASCCLFWKSMTASVIVLRYIIRPLRAL